jgi:hypothetical protein
MALASIHLSTEMLRFCHRSRRTPMFFKSMLAARK